MHTPTPLLQSDIRKSVHYYTQQGIHFHVATPNREGAPGRPDFNNFKSGQTIKSLVTVFPPTRRVTLFLQLQRYHKIQGSSTT